MGSNAHVVGLIADILDRSRISGVARAVGVEVEFASDPDELEALISPETRSILVDLSDPEVRPVEAILRTVAARSNDSGLPRLVGFAPHSDKTGIRAAREAGCDEVLVRSAFFRRLSLLLAEGLEEE